MADPCQNQDARDAARDWARLMADAQAGDQAAYHRLLKEVLPVVRAIVRRRIFDPVLVEDVVQETLLAMHRVRHTFDPTRPFLPWLVAIATARTIDAQRARGRLVRREVSDPEALHAYPDKFATNPVTEAALAADVRYRLEALPQRQRQAVELVKLQQLSVADAARASNQSVSAVKSLLNRAMATLRLHKDADNG